MHVVEVEAIAAVTVADAEEAVHIESWQARFTGSELPVSIGQQTESGETDGIEIERGVRTRIQRVVYRPVVAVAQFVDQRWREDMQPLSCQVLVTSGDEVLEDRIVTRSCDISNVLECVASENLVLSREVVIAADK